MRPKLTKQYGIIRGSIPRLLRNVTDLGRGEAAHLAVLWPIASPASLFVPGFLNQFNHFKMSNKEIVIMMLEALLDKEYDDGSIICDDLAIDIKDIAEFIEENL